MSGTSQSGRKGAKARDNAPVEPNSGIFTAVLPPYLKDDDNARSFWESTVSELEGILTNQHAYSLELMAGLYSEVVQLKAFLRENGYTFIRESDRKATNPAARPEVGLLKDRRSELNKMMVQFGLTPRSAQQIKKKGKGKGPSGNRLGDKYS